MMGGWSDCRARLADGSTLAQGSGRTIVLLTSNCRYCTFNHRANDGRHFPDERIAAML